MSWIMAGVASAQATIAGVQYVKGKQDQKKAERDRPKYDIGQYKENLNQANQQALQGTPVAQKQQGLYNIQQSMAGALYETKQRKGGLTGIAALNQNQIQSNQNIMTIDAQARMQNQQNLMNVRGQYADYMGQKFQINESNPFYERNAQKQARTGALFQNLNNAGAMAAGANFGGKRNDPIDNTNSGAGYKKYPSAYNSFQLDNNNVGIGGQYNNPTPMFGSNQGYSNPYGQNSGSYLDPNDNIFSR